MQLNEISKFTVMMAAMGELYGKTISSLLTDIYWQALKQFELEDVQHAFESHINNPDCGQYFPKPADVVRFIEGSGETKALHAWTKVEQAMIQVGSYQSIVFDDSLIHAVIESMGGWVKFCSMKNDDMSFRSNEFQKRYMGYVNKKPERYPKYLWGISEKENNKNGFEVAPPLLLGDTKKAEQVFLTGGGKPLILQDPNQYLAQAVLQISQSKMNSHDNES